VEGSRFARPKVISSLLVSVATVYRRLSLAHAPWAGLGGPILDVARPTAAARTVPTRTKITDVDRIYKLTLLPSRRSNPASYWRSRPTSRGPRRFAGLVEPVRS
jgi:hypothetical protein